MNKSLARLTDDELKEMLDDAYRGFFTSTMVLVIRKEITLNDHLMKYADMVNELRHEWSERKPL